jgi:hypothetical protein
MNPPDALSYPDTPHVRKHGPKGYDPHNSYDQWLRDEFTFRCVYCLEREMWYPNRGAAFAVEHVLPKAIPQYEHLKNDYTNLVYACSRCNSLKGRNLLIDPTKESLACHVVVRDDGRVESNTKEGEKLIDLLHLNCEAALATRKLILNIINAERNNPKISEIREIFLAKFCFPEALPDLRQTRVDNDRPDGIDNCYFALREQGILPEYY